MNAGPSRGEIDRIVRDLYADLDLGEPKNFDQDFDLSEVFSHVSVLNEAQFAEVAMDLSCLAGASGDWQVAHDIFLKLESSKNFTSTNKTTLWHLRCLIELERFSEALAIVRAHRWTPKEQIHVNYMAGLAFESLGMSEEAQTRFDAVYRKNPNYRDIAQRRLKV